jgi:hypothetical protein
MLAPMRLRRRDTGHAATERASQHHCTPKLFACLSRGNAATASCSPDFATMPGPLTEEKPLSFIRLHLLSRKRLTRIVASVLTLLLAGAIFVIWFVAPRASSSSLPANISQQSFGSSSQSAGTSTPTGGALHVYVTGSVKHPGVYTLQAGARVYQLLLVAGGALPQADLVSLNLAAPLTDGQEVYQVKHNVISSFS